MTSSVPDGPDTELAAAEAWFREDPKRLDFAPITEWSRHLRTIVRAYLARPDGAPQHLVRGDRVETADGVRATVTGPAPRGPNGEPAVNLDWDGDTGGPAYEHDLRRVPDATGGRDLTAADVAAVVRDYLGLHRTAQRLADRLNGIARPAAGRDLTDVEDGPSAVELLDALEGMGAALVDIGIAVGLPRPSATEVWGAPEILARIATLNSELGVPPRATARIAQARADQAEGYGSTTSTVEGLLRELDRRGGELVRLRAACARPAVARTDGQCTCGDPSAADLVHHTEAPCRTVEELRTGRTDGQPHPDPRGRYDVPDPYDHPGWPLVSRIVAIATDTAPTMPNETDGVDNAVTGLLADQSWRDHVAMADVMGLVGDWGTDDVVQAVTDALHEYPRLRALVARTDGQPPADPEDSPWAALVRELKAHADQVAAGDLSGLPATEYQCGLVDGYRGAAGRVRQVLIQQSEAAAPADDTAAPDDDHTTEHRAVMSGYGTGARGDLNMLRRVYRPQIEAGEIWIESRTVSPWIRVPDAGQPVRDSQDGEA